MSNPFEDENGRFVVLRNEEGQHSLWPSFLAVPGGWTVAAPEASRAECLEYVERNWIDMRPKSLAAAMDNAAGEG